MFFITNGYSEKLVKKTMEEFWAKEILKVVLVGVEQEVEGRTKQYNEVLHAPYIQGLSEGLGKKLRRLGIGYVPNRGETIYTNVCKLKQKMELENW